MSTSALTMDRPPVGPLTAVLGQRAASEGGKLAFRFLTDGEESEQLLHLGELVSRARVRAGSLADAGATGKPVLLMESPGLDFIIGLFACWFAGAIAVPAYPPRGNRHRQRLEAVLRDSGARLAIGEAPPKPIPGLTILTSVELSTGSPFERDVPHTGPCLLQYTSGSTAKPKGVVLHHHHLRHHLSMLGHGLRDLGIRSMLSWLPPYHDMGLILKVLTSLDAGMPLTFFSPDHFVQRPVRWLRAISRYRANFSGAPNFAFDLCLRSIRDEELAGLDLSCWTGAPTGAERIRAETLQRFARRFSPYGFRPETFLPGYGLAEATLTVTACRSGKFQRVSHHPQAGQHVSCGPVVDGSSLRIADPATGHTLPDRQIGEIRIKGPGVAAGYWNRPEETAKVFGTDGELRTGDRGYLEDDELHVVGRIKDLIILGGVNLAPEDVESALARSFPQFSTAAAFAGETPVGEGLVLAIESPKLTERELGELAIAIRRSIADSLELPIHRIVFTRAGTLPRTTSGKLKRSAAREAFRSDKLAVIFDEADQSPALPPGGRWLETVLDAVREVSGRDGVGADDDLIAFGLSSIEATRLSALLQATTGIETSLAELFSARSFEHLAASFEGKSPLPQREIVPGSGRHSGMLTHSQERMGFLHELEPEGAAYNVFGALEMEGPLDAGALGRAFSAVISRHAILRSRHVFRDGRLTMILDDSPPPAIEVSSGPQEQALRGFALRPFDLANDSPIRALLISSGKEHHIFALCAHHIVADGWAVRLLIRDLAAYYATFSGGIQAPAPLAGADYLDYAAWHRGWIESGAADAATFYWKRRLAGHPGIMDLATDFPRPAKPSSRGGAIERTVPASLVERVKALARARRVTPFMIQLAAFMLLLRRHGANDDQVIAVPVANRNHAAAADLVGTLVNTLPFRMTLDPSETFLTLLDRVRDATLEMQGAQDAPFERIIEALRPERARDRSPLAQVMFDHQELPISDAWQGGLRCRPLIVHRGAVQFDLSLLYLVLTDRQQVVLEYRGDLFREQTAAAMLDRYLATLEAVCRESERPVHSIDGLSESDLRHLLSVGQGPERPDFPKQTAPALIAATCRRLGGKTAIVCGEELLDYATLDSRSAALASSLRAKGVRPGDRVALLLERDLLLPVAILATWKCGAAYVPLDSANPPERLALVLEDQKPVHVLVSPSLADNLPRNTKFIVLDGKMAESSGAPPLEEAPVSPQGTAYILYTSGSTGKPKGVVVSHGALANFLLSMQEKPGFTEGQRLLAVTTVSFDISTLEIFLPLIAGGTVDLVSGSVSRDPAALLARLDATTPDVMQATPATWRMLMDAGWEGSPAMKILCGGEAMDLPLARRLLPLGSELWNLYGPTETTVWSTIWRVPEDPARILIGHPIANTGIHIASSDGSPLPPGVPGELLISGAGLADGYWQDAELTDEQFVATASAEMPRVYRTGDMARWLEDGALEYLGRSDGQIKIRGFRVELGEIDAALLSHLGVAEAATVFSEGRLMAWYRPVVPGLPAAEITEHLRDRLPDYMIPAPLTSIDRMPLTASGKIDRKALAMRPLLDAEKPTASKVSDALESELCLIWAEALGCRHVSPGDDFFAMGGHSLIAAGLVTEATKRTGITVSLDWLFDKPTPAGMAAQIREMTGPDLAKPRVIPLSSGQGGTPLFWCHTLVDGGMGLLPYRETAKLLGDVTDSYGIAEGTRGHETLPAMAAAHVEQIRATQPRGPYRLAGFCFGGNLAAEVAAQLADAGEEIELLCLLEASPPGAATGYNPWLRPTTWTRILTRLPGRVTSLMARDHEAALRRLKMKQRAAASQMNRLSGKDGIPDIRGVLDLDLLDASAQERAKLHWEALHKHTPRLPCAHRIVLIRADDEGWLPRPPTLGWSAPCKIEVHTVPGRHEEFLHQRSAREVADMMRKVLSP